MSSEKAKFACKFCNLELSSRYRRTLHECSHYQKESWQCSECREKFTTLSKYKTHVKKIQKCKNSKNIMKSFPCPKCNIEFSSLYKRSIHIHSGKCINDTNDLCELEESKKIKIESYYKFQCRFCSCKLRTRNERINHENKHFYNSNCPGCGKEFTQNNSDLILKDQHIGICQYVNNESIVEMILQSKIKFCVDES